MNRFRKNRAKILLSLFLASIAYFVSASFISFIVIFSITLVTVSFIGKMLENSGAGFITVWGFIKNNWKKLLIVYLVTFVAIFIYIPTTNQFATI